MSKTAEAVLNAQVSETELQAAMAATSKFMQDFKTFESQVHRFMGDLKDLHYKAATLVNAIVSMDRRVKESEITLAKNAEEATRRLSNVEQGHRAIIERVSAKEIALDGKVAELEKRELKVRAEIERATLLATEYERKLAAIAAVPLPTHGGTKVGK